MSTDNSAIPINRILIVDDDMMMRELMKEAIIMDDYIIEEFDNGIDALEAVIRSEPEMILLDVKMPGMSGFEVCSAIRNELGLDNISVVMVTGLEDSRSIEKAFSLGATAFINKPINSLTFRYQIQYLLKARNAFAEIKERETHLDYMERISRILAQSMTVDSIVHQALEEMLDIFAADRAFIIKAANTNSAELEVAYEAARKPYEGISGQLSQYISNQERELLHKAEFSEFPLVSAFTLPAAKLRHDLPDPGDSGQNHIEMIRALHLRDDRIWFLVIHQYASIRPWSTLEQETYYRISSRLNNLLSRNLLMESLHRSEYLLRQAQRIGHLGNWSLNLKTNELSWSDEMYRIYGYEPGSIKPSRDDFFRIEFEEDNARQEQFEQAIFKSDGTYSIEHRIRLPDNEVRWVQEQGVATFDENGSLVEVNGTVQDITANIRKKEQEVHEQKMEAVGQLTSGIAHDFGNLMTIAKGNLELLDEAFVEHYQIDKENLDILNDARSAIHDSVELTKQLLASSRRKSIAPEYLNIKDNILKFSKLLKNTIGDKIELSIQVEEDLPDILVDLAQFESSLLNVIINARDAMPDGGLISIIADTDIEHDKPAHTPDNAEHSVRICIEDTGTGMSDEVLKRATEPFFTTKKDAGTGLGLSMVYGFMRQSNGELIISSEPGKGSRITMLFPVYGGKESNTDSTASSDIQPFNGETVLVVEDRDAVRRYALRCLDKLNLVLLEAGDALSAKRILESNDDIDCLFTDILMPGEMNGRELANWALENNPELKILLTTASEKEASLQQAATARNFPLLSKPYSKTELIEKLHLIFQ